MPSTISKVESSGSGTVLGEHAYATPGVYHLSLTVSDEDLSGEAEYRYVVVFDPDGGFVTGGGWIESPTGAYAPDPALTAKATFGFVSKYTKGGLAASRMRNRTGLSLRVARCR